MFTEDGTRSRSHALRPEVVARQAELLSLHLVSGRGSWKTYEEEFKRVLHELAKDGFSHVIFGDIFLDEHRYGLSGSVKSAALRRSSRCGEIKQPRCFENSLQPAHKLKLSRLKQYCSITNGLARRSLKRCCQISSLWVWTPVESEASTTRSCSPLPE